jgi:hypothetical protein
MNMLDSKRIYVDFIKLDEDRRLILSCRGTHNDLARYNIKLEEGLVLTFYSDDADDDGNNDDLVVQGTVHYNTNLNEWVASINWEDIKHVSDYQKKS